VPHFDGRMRAREFWSSTLPSLRQRLEHMVSRAGVVHAAVADLYKPAMELAFVSALRRGIPTVFVQDTDTVVQLREEARHAPVSTRLATEAYARVYERACRASVARADLSLLKGKDVMLRYGAYAKNAREFHNSSYLASEVASDHTIERRLATLHDDRPLRLLYCGRLVERKGVDASIRIVAEARRRGANVTFDIIGHGPSEPALQALVQSEGVGDAVQLLGASSYDSALLQRLAGYDAMLFTPTIEDTPRMIFDGYASGLPLLGLDIPYVRERAREEGATLLLPRRDEHVAAERLCALDRDRGSLIPLSRAALAAGHHHAADAWYARRAEWTHEAVARKLRTPPRRPIASSPPSPPSPPQGPNAPTRPVQAQATL
jgi:glycosyltransferase involved in cell wall biosynthesis